MLKNTHVLAGILVVQSNEVMYHIPANICFSSKGKYFLYAIKKLYCIVSVKFYGKIFPHAFLGLIHLMHLVDMNSLDHHYTDDFMGKIMGRLTSPSESTSNKIKITFLHWWYLLMMCFASAPYGPMWQQNHRLLLPSHISSDLINQSATWMTSSVQLRNIQYVIGNKRNWTKACLNLHSIWCYDINRHTDG